MVLLATLRFFRSIEVPGYFTSEMSVSGEITQVAPAKYLYTWLFDSAAAGFPGTAL